MNLETTPYRLRYIYKYTNENRISFKDFIDRFGIAKSTNELMLESEKLEPDTLNAKETPKYFQMETNKLKNNSIGNNIKLP